MSEKDRVSILVLDDEPTDRKMQERLIRWALPDALVTQASGVEEARLLQPDVPFDVVFLDFVMPKVEGFSAFRELQHLWPQAGFVIVTGKGDEKVAAEAIKIGAVDYVPKEGLREDSIERIIENARDKVRLRQLIEDQMRDLRGFANALLHDIRAPIRHMRFLCDEVMDGFTRGDRECVVDSVRGIDMSCNRMTELLAALVSYIEAGDAFDVASVDCDAVLARALEDLQDEIRYANAVVAAEPLPQVMGDAEQLRRLFQALIRNAIAYRSSRTPEIVIAAEVLESGAVQFAVTDNGIGVEPSFLERMFEPFRRLHGPKEGSRPGLGLATCRRIVTRHGGRIWCESLPGAGATIRFTLGRRGSEATIATGGELERLTRLLGEP